MLPLRCAAMVSRVTAPDDRSDLRLLALASIPGAWLCLLMPVFAQESYYWTYAQHPDLSYYDHPPMVAWMIWLGTRVFGDGALGIRFLTMLCGIATMALGMRMLRAWGANATARAAWALASSCAPALLATHFLANPDPPLCLFFLATMAALWKARNGGIRWWLLAGAFAGLALLSKYTAAFLAVSGAVLLLLDPSMRKQLLRPGPWLGVVTAAIVFAPVVMWNVNNDFESFRFQTESRFARANFRIDWLFQFLGQQIGVAHPALAAAIPFALLWLMRRARERDVRALWLLAFALPMPVFFLCNAPLMQVKPNWIAPSYLPLLLGASLWFSESGIKDRKPKLAKAAKVALLAVVPIVALAPLMVAWPQHRGSSWTGWSEIATATDAWEHRIDAEDKIDGNVFVFAADYKDAAQLTRALRQLATARHDSTPSPQALAQNVFGQPALQFDHWDAPAAHVGQSAIFVLPRANEREAMVERMRARFDSAEKVDHVDVTRLGVKVLDADIYVCRGYKGAK